ncbi:peptidase S41 [Actinoalloteichus sp. AHMU CJ021]|nr:peptidase S41 [Actinoalloteichus sp. AHMU CJ021]
MAEVNIAGYLRFPHLHADLLTFVAEDDVWLAPLDGGRAWRLTADRVPVTNPRFSPDGGQVAWTSTLDGGRAEVQVIGLEGGTSRRLTHWGAGRSRVLGWRSDDSGALSVVAASTVESHGARSWAYSVPLDGGPATKLPYGPLNDVSFGPDGQVVLGSYTMRDPGHWKRYRGGTTGKIWRDLDGAGEFERVHSELDGNLASPLWVNGRIVFLSDHEGVANLYSSEPDGSDLRRHSDHDRFYARFASTDGQRVVYQHAGEVWLLEDLDGTPRRIDVALTGAGANRRPTTATASDHLAAAVPDHTGRASAVLARGTVHWVSHRDGPVRALSATPGVRARMPRFVSERQAAENAPASVVFVTDAEGEDALEIVPVTGVEPGAEPRRIGAGQLGRVLALEVSPDGLTAAVTNHDNKLLAVDLVSGRIRVVTRAESSDPGDLAFSPDSKWLAWSHPGPDPLRHIRAVNLAAAVGDADELPASSIVDVTELRFVDTEPVFTQDGKYLAFLSERTFDPVYDAHVFDMSFPNACRPHLVPLAALTPSPFGPTTQGRPAPGETGEDGESTDSGESRQEATVLSVEGIAQRAVPFPVAAGNYHSLLPVKGGVVWLREQASGVLGDARPSQDAKAEQATLERYDLKENRLEVLVEDVDRVAVSGDGTRLLLTDGGALRLVPADRKAESNGPGGPVEIDLSRVRFTLDRGREWRQAFDEAGRLMRDRFWRSDMDGVDWAGVLDRYRPLTDRLGSHDDLIDLLWETQAELGTSHAYAVAPGGGDQQRRQGKLGADLVRDEEGNWRIGRVLPGETSDPAARSPLLAPGVAVQPGDVLVAVDGQPVDPVTGPAPQLVGSAGKEVELTIRPGAGGAVRRAVVVPLAGEEALRYQEWVADRRSYVRERSDGRLGYLHVPDMMAVGWAQLHRDLRLETQYDALVVDLRENGGGHLSQLVVEKLARQIIGYQFDRDGRGHASYPSDAPRGPVVALADELSGSDGDIVTGAIKALGVGTVIGVRTWGGTIGIDSRFRLVDGTLVTQPGYATWMRGREWGMENHGVEPDIEVVCRPQDWAAGRDPQLDTAIRVALERLAERPATAPPPWPSPRQGG